MSGSSQRHKAEAPTSLGFALVMCSTSRFESLKDKKQVDDPSGDLIVETLRSFGHQIVLRVLVPDDETKITEAVEMALKHDKVNAIVICGGTGISPKDMTTETVAPMLSKTLPGFGELFRKLSYDNIGSPAIMSRATAGLVKEKVVFCIPGSKNAVKLCLDKLILPEVGHIVKHAREKP
ncbi:MAG: MogA/MoaB family molybdenum cofactor biosynthesis protein [Candidatus Bathyarchaeota archaeon]|nr:MAG: MogA/MoaB family molybdenum cofactor biosynthesis protein [Candidatus Bathyarchaeota archaeon]